MGYHKRLLQLVTVLCAVFASPTMACGQATVGRMRLTPDLELTIGSNGMLTFIQSDEYGIVRKDQIALEQLDVVAIHSDSLGTLALPCAPGYGRCVHTVDFRLDQEKRSSTLRFKAPLEATSMKELAEMILLLRTDLAQQNAPLVTPAP